MKLNKNYKPKTEAWFLARLGKKIYRDDQGCKCETCKRITKEGMIVRNEQHARYLDAVDHDYAAEGIYSNYRDKL